ncbi:hypothetical protein [Ferrimicrobium sp.]|jgi:hypothetical protein|nr:hypothetical protein [Ferrimicrobium sp.]
MATALALSATWNPSSMRLSRKRVLGLGLGRSEFGRIWVCGADILWIIIDSTSLDLGIQTSRCPAAFSLGTTLSFVCALAPASITSFAWQTDDLITSLLKLR